MIEETGAAAFAAFREAVFGDIQLMMRLRPVLEREAYVAHIVTIGAERGFVFETSDIHAAMREGELAWLTQGIEVVV